jgi:hypothetical protein
MDKRAGAIATSIALMALCTATGARAQSPAMPNQQQTEQGGGMGQGGMMGRGRMGGMMSPGMMRRMMGRSMPGPMMRIIFALIDTDSDGTISLQEWQAAHERIFKAMDANKDGKVTLDEMQSFMTGQTGSASQQ